MSMNRCDQGHIYDSSVHRRCPSCGVAGLNMSPTRPAAPPNGPSGPASAGSGPRPGPSSPTMRVGPILPPRGARPGSELPQDDAASYRAAGRETRPRSVPGRTSGVTVAFWQKPSKDEVAREAATVDPVVGWLVAIDGPEGIKGRDYRLYSEGNPIGRDNHHRVAIKDDTISRDVHAVLTYDPRSEDSAYYIQPGGRHMVYRIRYVQDPDGGPAQMAREAVLTPTRLEAFDMVEIGKTKLLFVPLCNDRFRWQWE